MVRLIVRIDADSRSDLVVELQRAKVGIDSGIANDSFERRCADGYWRLTTMAEDYAQNKADMAGLSNVAEDWRRPSMHPAFDIDSNVKPGGKE